MKYLIGLVFLIAHTFGEAPAPYPASGWRPQGPAFELPSENNSRLKQALPQTIPPSTSYGVPELQYGAPGAQLNAAPQNQYGPPVKQLAPQTQIGAPRKLPPTQLGPPQIPQSQQQIPQNRYGAPSSSVPQSQQQIPQNQYGAPSSSVSQSQQQIPQNQYGAPSSSVSQSQQQIPQNQYGAPSSSVSQSQQQIPQNQYGAPSSTVSQSQQQIPQNQYGTTSNPAPQNQFGPPAKQFGPPQFPQTPQNQFGAPSNQYGSSFEQTELKLTPQQQQLLLSQLIKLQQFLSSQKRQQVAPQNEYGTAPSSVDVRSSGANNPQNQYEPPSSVEPLNGDQSNQFTPNTQYLPSFTSSAFRPEVQPSFRSDNNGKRLSFSGDQGSFESQNQNQDEDGYKTIVLSTQEEDDYNRKYGAPVPTTDLPPVIRRRPQSIPETPKGESDGEESFDDASSVDPNISVANAFASGRYYLLLPDGRLQKVIYKTTQSEDEAKTNGFTANLMYQLVEPIKDPIYTVDGTPYVPVSQN